MKKWLMMSDCASVTFGLGAIYNFAILDGAAGDGVSAEKWLCHAVSSYSKSRRRSRDASGPDRLEIEIFCFVAESSPEILCDSWAAIFDDVREDAMYWVQPEITFEELEAGLKARQAYLNQQLLAKNWRGLRGRGELAVLLARQALQAAGACF